MDKVSQGSVVAFTGLCIVAGIIHGRKIEVLCQKSHNCDVDLESIMESVNDFFDTLGEFFNEIH